MGEKVQLGNIGLFASGGTPSRKHDEYFQGNIPWVTTVALNGGHIGTANAQQMITSEAIQHSATKLIPAGSIFVGIRVGIGKVAITDVPMCSNQDIVAISNIDESQWDIDYLCYAIQSQSYYLLAQKQGATISGISSKLLKSVEIRHPSLDVQHSVVDHLRTIENQISLIEQMLVKADELVQSRFAEMFLDGSLPKVSIGKLASDVRYGTSKKASGQGDYIYIRMNNITDDGYLDLSDVKYISLEGQELEKCMVIKGDVLFNRTNSREKVGKTAVFLEDRPMVIAGYIIRIRLGAEMRGEYLSAFMNLHSVKAMLRDMAKGAVHQANINAKELAAVEVPLPPLALQNEFAAFVAQVESMKFSLTAQRDRLNTLYDSLAQRYFAE